MKLPQIGLLLGALSSALFFTGCATITRGTHEALVIETEPSGAQVRLSTGLTGSTPNSFKISRKGEVVVTIIKEGYETVTLNVTTQVAGAGAAGMAGNVLVGGIIGVGIDAFSGGMLEHKPNPVKVTLVPIKIPAAVVAVAPIAAPMPVATSAAAIPTPLPVPESPVPNPGPAPVATSPAASAPVSEPAPTPSPSPAPETTAAPGSKLAPAPTNEPAPSPAITAAPDSAPGPTTEKEKS